LGVGPRCELGSGRANLKFDCFEPPRHQDHLEYFWLLQPENRETTLCLCLPSVARRAKGGGEGLLYVLVVKIAMTAKFLQPFDPRCAEARLTEIQKIKQKAVIKIKFKRFRS
jgi:hypothetical protein